MMYHGFNQTFSMPGKILTKRHVKIPEKIHLWWNLSQDCWTSAPAPSGHYDNVTDITWSPDKSYLLSSRNGSVNGLRR